MSHDQRPGKMRVVQDATRTHGNRAGDAKTAGGAAQRAGAEAAAGKADQAQTAAPAAAGGALPMLQAALFLLACVAGGVVVALVQPF